MFITCDYNPLQIWLALKHVSENFSPSLLKDVIILKYFYCFASYAHLILSVLIRALPMFSTTFRQGEPTVGSPCL